MKFTQVKWNLFLITLLYGLSFFIVSNILYAASATVASSSYKVIKNKLCDGYPQVQVSSKEGTCLGLMVDSVQGLRMPRYAAQLRSNIILVTDMGGWSYGRGTVWAIMESVDQAGLKKTSIINLFPKTVITMPNGIAIDNEDRVYIGTPTAILRFSPLKNHKLVLDPKMEVVVSDFGASPFRQEFDSKEAYKKTDNLHHDLHYEHSLINFVFDRKFQNLYVNIGSLSDACQNGYVSIRDHFCEQTEGVDSTGAIYHYEVNLNTPAPEILKREVFARGLRNSMALAFHDLSGNLLQGENGRDFPEVNRPNEELNWIRQGSHYGWPYCYDDGKVSDEFKKVVTSEDCLGAKYTKPLVMLPPHSAPLAMLYDSNKLYISLHGYRETGHRLITFDVDPNTGLPLSQNFENVVYNWSSLAGVRPKGSPIGLLKLHDGSLLIVEDKNKTILRLSSGETFREDQNSDDEKRKKEDDKKREDDKKNRNEKKTLSEEDIRSFQILRDKFFSKSCVQCHDDIFRTQFTVPQVIDALYNQGFVDPNSFAQSKIYMRLNPENSNLMPPYGSQPELSKSDREEILNTLSKIFGKQ